MIMQRIHSLCDKVFRFVVLKIFVRQRRWFAASNEIFIDKYQNFELNNQVSSRKSKYFDLSDEVSSIQKWCFDLSNKYLLEWNNTLIWVTTFVLQEV